MVVRAWGVVAIVHLVLVGIRPAEAALLVYEPFDYPAGTALDGLAASGLNLAGSYTKSTIQDLEIASPGLGYGSLINAPQAVGNRLNDTSGAGAGSITVALADEVAIPAGQAIYFSALMTLDDLNNANRYVQVNLVDDNTGDEITFGEAVVGSRAIRIEANTASTGAIVVDGADQSFADGQTLLLIGRYYNSALASGDELALLGYDTATAQSIASTFELSDPAAQFAYSVSGIDIDMERITSLRLEIRGANNNFLDEVRIGSTYAAVVVPEPTAGVLIILAMGGIGLVGRRLRGVGG